METNCKHTPHPPRLTGGYLMLLALAFGAIFTTILGALTGYAVIRDKAANVAQSRNEALALADAGINAYGWRLNHVPGTDTSTEETFTLSDSESGAGGEASVVATPTTACGVTTSILARSTGTPVNAADTSAVVSARFARPTITTHNALVSINTLPANFVLPDLTSLKSIAETQGKYLQVDPIANDGLHLVFNVDGSVVASAVQASGATIESESPIAEFSLPADCGLIFVENNVWIEGTVTGKVMVVADTEDGAANVVLNGTVGYAGWGAGLTVMTRDKVLIPDQTAAGDSPPFTPTLGTDFAYTNWRQE